MCKQKTVTTFEPGNLDTSVRFSLVEELLCLIRCFIMVIELVEQNGFRKSMSRPGIPSDNQPVESFWKMLE